MYKNIDMTNRQRQKHSFFVLFLTIMNFFCFSGNLSATPVLGQIASGDVHIAEQANNLQITQNTQQAIVNWNSFNINAQERILSKHNLH